MNRVIALERDDDIVRELLAPFRFGFSRSA